MKCVSSGCLYLSSVLNGNAARAVGFDWGIETFPVDLLWRHGVNGQRGGKIGSEFYLSVLLHNLVMSRCCK